MSVINFSKVIIVEYAMFVDVTVFLMLELKENLCLPWMKIIMLYNTPVKTCIKDNILITV